jgi:hypothetical protein
MSLSPGLVSFNSRLSLSRHHVSRVHFRYPLRVQQVEFCRPVSEFSKTVAGARNHRYLAGAQDRNSTEDLEIFNARALTVGCASYGWLARA